MATPSWNTPIACTTCCLTSGTQTISKLDKKWSATAIKASFGQRLNQSIVHPLIRPGNLSDLLRNFSPTWTRKKRRKRWAWELTLMRLIDWQECIYFLFHFFDTKSTTSFEFYGRALWSRYLSCYFYKLMWIWTYRRETQNNMKIVLGSRQEVVVQIFPCRWSPGKFLLHHRYQLAADFVDLIASKKIGYFAGG